MKNKLSFVVVLLVIVRAAVCFAGPDDASALLQKGLFEEEANRNLDAAIRAYQSVVTQTDKDHQLAATAIFRLGECYRKQGKTNEATAQYQRILREFSDQTDLVKLSQQQLGPEAAPVANPTPPIVPNDEQQAKLVAAKTKVDEYASQLSELKDAETSFNSPERLALLLQREYPSPTINALADELTKNAQQLVLLSETKGEDAPEVKTAVQLKKHLEPQIFYEYDGVRQEILRKLDEAKSVYAALQAQAPPTAASAKESLDAIETELKEIESLPVEQRRVVIQQRHPTTLLSTLVANLAEAEQRLATLQTGLGGQNPDVQSAEALIKTLQKQIDEQEAGILLDLQAKRDAARKAYQALGYQPGGVNEPVATSLPPDISAQNRDKIEADDVKRLSDMIKDSPDLINQGPRTPLCVAVSEGRLKVAKFLLDNHADPDLREHDGVFPLEIAVCNRNNEMIDLLLTQANVTMTSEGQFAQMNQTLGYSVLHHSVLLGDKSIAQKLLEHGANVNAQDTSGKSPLYLAAEKGLKAVAELLLAHGADVALPDYAGVTPLYAAVRAGNLAIAELLVTNHADVNAKNKYGDTALFAVASSGNKALAEFLLAHGAEPNIWDVNGMTPLLLAASNDHIEVARLLLEHGANVNAEIKSPNSPESNWTALHLAISKNDNAFVELLLNNHADPNAVVNSVPTGPNNFTQMPGATPLMMTVQLNQKDDAESLLAHHANIDARDKSGHTALHWSVNHNGNLAELLLNHGANVNAPDNNGNTPFHFAACTSTNLVVLLLAHHADVNAKNNDGNTPLDMHFQQLGSQPTALQPHSKGETGDPMTDLLRSHGGITELESGSIRIMGTDPHLLTVVFRRDANSYNHFTLFETIDNAFAPLDVPTMSSDYAPEGLRFSDFSHVKIHHLNPAGTTNFSVLDLNALFAAGDCSKDIPMQWGDIVEIPELDHNVNAYWGGIGTDIRNALDKCLERHVEIIVKGQSMKVLLKPKAAIFSSPLAPTGRTDSSSPYNSNNLQWTFRLNDVVRGANVILASSDLTRVKVKRLNPATHKTSEMIFNLEKVSPSTDLWLRDGDIIEIPEKP